MKMKTSTLGIAACLLLATATATGCSQAASVGGDPATWTPISITPADNAGTIDMVVGQVALFEDLPLNNGEDLNFVADPTGIVTIERAEGDSEVVSAGPSLIAAAPGTTTVTVSYDEADQTVLQFTVNVTE
jgi:hypothetical protein